MATIKTRAYLTIVLLFPSSLVAELLVLLRSDSNQEVSVVVRMNNAELQKNIAGVQASMPFHALLQSFDR